MLSASLLLLTFAASPTLAARPPANRQVTLVICSDVADCAAELMWVSNLPEYQGQDIMLADTVLELNSGGWEGGLPIDQRFRSAMDRAREQVAEKRWASAEGALDDAEGALSRWAGLATTQEIFDLHFLRGLVRFERGSDSGYDTSFQQAAATTWNRQVTFPTDDDEVLHAYYLALQELIEGGTGLIHLEGSSPGTVCYLDGVELGPPPVEVQVFPGRHRLTAVLQDQSFQWKRDMTVRAGQSSSTSARFSQAGDSRWVIGQLASAVRTHRLEPEVADILGEWSSSQGISSIRLAMARPLDTAGSTPPTAAEIAQREHAPEYDLSRVLFDPKLRAFRAE